MQKAAISHDASFNVNDGIEYRIIKKNDLPDAVRIYLQSFPARVRRWFGKESQAAQFYLDLMELMRLAYGRTFFAARYQDRLVGYLILTLPRPSLFAALFREGFILHAAAHALMGRYGFSVSVLSKAFLGLFSSGNSEVESRLSDSPHIYVVAVEKEFTGKGIGSALVEQARAICQGQFHRIWLCVERENAGAVRLYERIGFRILESDTLQHVMVWEFEAPEAATKTA